MFPEYRMRQCGNFMRLSCGRIKIETFEVAGPILHGGVAMNREQGRTFGLRQLGNERRTL